MGLSLLLVNFVVELVKFIFDFRLIKFFIAFKISIILLRGAKYKFIETKC